MLVCFRVCRFACYCFYEIYSFSQIDLNSYLYYNVNKQLLFKVIAMKRKTTNDILAESFPELAQTKRIDKITISDITSNCGMSQPTFYNHFKDKYDLIVWIYTNHVREIMCKIDNKTFMWKDCLLGAALYYYENSEFIKNALKHTSGQDSDGRSLSDQRNGGACLRGRSL